MKVKSKILINPLTVTS